MFRPYFQKPRTQGPLPRPLSMVLQLEGISLPLLTFTLGVSSLQFLLNMCDYSDGVTVSVSETDNWVRAFLESDKNGQFSSFIFVDPSFPQI